MNPQKYWLIPADNLEEIILRLNWLRGLFAILIVIGHCSMEFERELLLFYIIHKFNMVGVCFFFYVSGLSLTYNFYHKQDYLKHFLRNKVLFLLVLALISALIGNLLRTFFLNVPLNWNIAMLTEFNWYVYEMIVFYIAFYLLYSMIFMPYYREFFMAVITVGICLITIYFDRYGSWFGWTKAYYISSFSFLFGIVMGEHYDGIRSRFRKHRVIYSIILFLFGLGCCISLKWPDGSWGRALVENLVGICVMSLVTEFVAFVNPKAIPGVSEIISFLTERSTEIYLYQFCLLSIVAELYARNSMVINISYILVVAVSVCILAYIMHFIDGWIGKLIKK